MMPSSSADPNPTPHLPDIIQRYLNGESTQALAKEYQTCFRTIYNWMLSEAGDQYEHLITQALIGRIADADQQMELARDSMQIARAREMAKFARMDFERRRPKLYGPKQEIQQDSTIRVIIAPPPPLHIDTQPSIIDAKAQVVDNIHGKS